VIIYEIHKIAHESDASKSENLQKAKSTFERNKISFEKVNEDFDQFSMGYSKQTMSFASKNQVQLLSLMATISKNETPMRVPDKEHFLTNEEGIPVLCCNA
jgi:hypothetical protein